MNARNDLVILIVHDQGREAPNVFRSLVQSLSDRRWFGRVERGAHESQQAIVSGTVDAARDSLSDLKPHSAGVGHSR
jgi:hypothetical protein